MNSRKIVSFFIIKIHLLILIVWCGNCFSVPLDSTETVVKARNDLKYPFKASFRRIQTYRSFPLVATGTANFSSDGSVAVTYAKPFKYAVTYYDTTTITVDKKRGNYKNHGYKNAMECDPFHVLMIYCHGQFQNLAYKGSFDSVQVYSGAAGKRNYLLSLERTSRLWRELSLVNSAGTVYERARFYYKDGNMPPLSVVVETLTGGDIVKDSLAIYNVRVGK